MAGQVAFDISYPKMRHQANFEPSGTWTLDGAKWILGVSGEEVSIREYLREGKPIRWIVAELGVGSHKVVAARKKMLAEGLLALNDRVVVGKKTTTPPTTH